MNDAEVAPEATVTEAGVLSAVVLLVRVTVVPVEGAAFEIVTLQEVLAFCARLVALHCSPETVSVRTGTTSAIDVFADEPLSVAVMVAVTAEVSTPVLMGIEAEVAFAGTVTEAGTVSPPPVVFSVTTTPPAGAACEIVTVQELLAFCARLATTHCNEETTVGATSVTDAFAEEPFNAAPIVAVCPDVIVPAVTVKVPALLPEATVTEAGTVRMVELTPELSVTVAPPSPTGAPLRVTVQVEEAPEAIDPGEQLTELTVSVVDVGGGVVVVPVPVPVEMVIVPPVADAVTD